MSTVVISGPTAECIHLSEAKAHLNIDSSFTSDDSLITRNIGSARGWVERVTGQRMVVQTVEQYAQAFPDSDEILLEHGPLISVVSVKYIESDGDESTMPSTDYLVDTARLRPRIKLAYGKSWPTSTLETLNPIKIRYVVGFLTPFTANASTDVLTLSGRTIANDTVVRLYNSGGALPTGLSTLTDYYVVQTSGSTIKLSLNSGGSAIDVTGTGSGTQFVGELEFELLAAMLLLVGDLYRHREDTLISTTGIGTKADLIPRGVNHLLANYRIHAAA